jgi:uncharacterized protein (DUF1330 family)
MAPPLRVEEPALERRVRERARTGIAALGGRYITRTENITALDGTPPKRFVVIQFDSVEKAKAWNATPEVALINAIHAIKIVSERLENSDALAVC